MTISDEQVQQLLTVQTEEGIDTYKSINLPLALAVARQWATGNLDDEQMRLAYRNLAALCPEIRLQQGGK